jgi:general secretion pathway protein K
VLWVLAGLTVVAVSVASSARASAESVKLLRDRVRAEAAFLSTASRIEVLASTGTAGRTYYEGDRGRLFVDGRSVAANPGEWVTVQDGRGLVNLNRPDPVRLRQLLQRCGVAEADAPKLVDTLADYVDEDSLKRVNGAEAFEYRGAGLAEPRNAQLLSREELWRVVGWPAIRSSWQQAGCDGHVTVRGDSFFNRNTAPLDVLMADGMSPETAKAFVASRRDGLPSIDIQTIGGDPSNPFNFAGGGFAGTTMRVQHVMASVEWTLEYELELTPLRNGGPWRLHEIRSPTRKANIQQAGSALPPVNYRLSDSDRTLNDAASRLPFSN